MNPTLRRRVAGGTGAIGIAVALVTYFEGTRLHAYPDTIEVATICVGHTKNVHLGDVATPADCDRWLRQDLASAIADVHRCITVQLTDKQQAALIDATYNIGPRVVCGSTLQRLANSGAPANQWCGQLMRWTYADGRQLPGLVKRRQAEVELCEGG